MRICFCVDSLGCGGVERVVSNLSNRFSEDNSNTVIIVVVSSQSIDSYYSLSKRIKVVSLIRDSQRKVPPFKRIRLLKKLFREYNPDIVLSFIFHISIYCYFALLKNNVITHICCERTSPMDEPKYLYKFLRNIAFKHADGCIFQTKEALDYYKGKIKNYCIIPNPISSSISYNSCNFNDRNKVFCASGRLCKQKDYITLIKAFAIFKIDHKDYELHIYGNGEDKAQLSNYIKKHKIDDIIFYGSVNDWINKEISSKGYILSSIYEGMPNSLMEALCSGIPCISSDCNAGGPRFLINNKTNGLLFCVRDYVELSQLMKSLADDEDLSNSLTKSNANLLKRFDIETISEKWISFITKCCGEKNGIKKGNS